MALLHAALIAPGMEREKKALLEQMQLEVRNAKRIQAQTGCSWTEALRAAATREVRPLPR